MEKLFKLKEHGTDVRTEVLAGVTTFLAMAYILAVNPSILSAAGMDPAAVFTATAVSAAFATLCMAFFANYPVALASGLGLNAYFAYSVCIPLAQEGVNDPWKIALAAILVEGVIFVLLSLTNFREKLVNDIPANLKHGISAGIGLFIVIIALINGGVVVQDPATALALGDMGSPQVVLALLGFILIAVLHHYRIMGYILIGILATWGMGMLAQLAGWYVVDPDAGALSMFPAFTGSLLPSAPYFFEFDFSWVASHLLQFAVIVFSFLYVDIFDTVGTLVAVAAKGDLLDKDGRLPNAKGALMADAVGTIVGAILGTSTVSSYVESSAGVAQGGRTGLTSVTTAIFFLIALFLSPIFLAIPSFATTPALMWVGFLMLQSIRNIDFKGDASEVVAAYMAIIMMPFTYSIATGIMFATLTFVILKVFTGKAKEVPMVLWVAFVLFVLRLITLVHPIAI
ncbi:MAG: NCS2 family permease [Eubacterium sp.]|nr:NCS2 family permease [Eubacterium sp.]